MDFSLLAMQLFGGLTHFTILLLMAVGLAIVFGLMGVINMAHGELMTMGAYTTYLTSIIFLRYFPSLIDIYLFVAIIAAFGVTALFGYILERWFIRFFYNRTLDTLLATWGLSLILQQLYRSVFGAQDVQVPGPRWLQGAWEPTSNIQIPLNGMFIIALTVVVVLALYWILYRTKWGLKVRAITQNRTMSGAAGINTRRVDGLTFALGSGIAGLAGCAFTLIGSTGPGSGQLYIVEAFIVVVFGSVQSLLGTIASAFIIGESQTTLEYVLSGSMAKVLVLLAVILVLYWKPDGLFSSRVRR